MLLDHQPSVIHRNVLIGLPEKILILMQPVLEERLPERHPNFALASVGVLPPIVRQRDIAQYAPSSSSIALALQQVWLRYSMLYSVDPTGDAYCRIE